MRSRAKHAHNDDPTRLRQVHGLRGVSKNDERVAAAGEAANRLSAQAKLKVQLGSAGALLRKRVLGRSFGSTRLMV
jgi:hypothetical protein